MFLLGLLLGFGCYLVAVGLFDLSHQVRSRFSVGSMLQSDTFSYQLNVSLLSSVTLALLAGILRSDFVLVSAVSGFIGGWIVTVMQLQKEKQSRNLQIALATSTLAEDCAILSTTHLGLRRSLQRAINAAPTELQRRLRELVVDGSEQTLLNHQLALISQRERENELGRFARTLSVAIERGNSPGASLQKLAEEIRNHTRRELLQLAAKKEIQMMVPVVFAVLPSVTAVALYPAMKSLEHL